MGVVGTSIFSDDLAADIRAEFRTKIADGLDGPTATDSLLSKWAGALADSETRSVFWIALAAAQSECGRLEDRVKHEALAIIAHGTDLQRWKHHPGLLAKRRAVLNRLRTRLEAAPRKPTRIAKPFVATCDWEVDEIIAYRLRSGNFVAFRITGHLSSGGSRQPECELLDWMGPALPSPADLKTVGIRRGFYPRDQIKFIVLQARKSDPSLKRLHRLGFHVPPSLSAIATRQAGTPRSIKELVDPAFGIGCMFWKSIDQELETVFRLA